MFKQYQAVTDRIIAFLDSGVRPWSQGWNAPGGGGRPLRHDGTPYRGANVVNLWAAGMGRSFCSPYWMTYKCAHELGAQVKRGARSELAFFVGSITRREEVDGEEADRTIPFLKAYNVFNPDEIEGLKSHYYQRTERAELPHHARIPHADAFIANTGACIVHGGGRAFFQPAADTIRLPALADFDHAAGYYGIALHELTHWTGAEPRLARLKGKLFGSPDYAFEELVAELGAAYLSADLAITAEPREDHASYIASWLKCLREDNRAIFRAAAHAERACGFLHALQPQALAAD